MSRARRVRCSECGCPVAEWWHSRCAACRELADQHNARIADALGVCGYGTCAECGRDEVSLTGTQCDRCFDAASARLRAGRVA